MPRVHIECKHEYRLDVPHYFSKEDDTIQDHYNIELQLTADEGRDEVFVHLVCPKCYDEQHTYMSHEELEYVLGGGKIIQSKLKLIK